MVPTELKSDTCPVAGGGPRKDGNEGVMGMKSLGARELTYRLMFIACGAAVGAVDALG